MKIYDDPQSCVDFAIQEVGTRIVLGAPLGIGKANTIINAFYDRAKRDTSIELTICTALTLTPSTSSDFLGARFLGPLNERLFGEYVPLSYSVDRESGTVPANIQIIEFYYPAGKLLKNVYAQQNYLSSNYTHVARDMMDRGVNVIAQMVAKRNGSFSLSSNPDVTLDLEKMLKASGKPHVLLGEVNSQMPYMFGQSEVGQDYFDATVEGAAYNQPLFAPPKFPVCLADHLIGMYASALMRDGGCLQVGIGSLGDAVVHALCLRQKDNAKYKLALGEISTEQSMQVMERLGEMDPFAEGLFGASEMFVDGFMHLYKNGILKKKVYDQPVLQRLLNDKKISTSLKKGDLKEIFALMGDKLTESDSLWLEKFGVLYGVSVKGDSLSLQNGTRLRNDLRSPSVVRSLEEHALGKQLKNGHVVHAGFFVGPNEFYEFLRTLPEEELKLFDMKSVGKINQLYWSEEIDTLQRHDARFINTCMMVTALGAAVSDALADGSVVSGVGGQYNFVAMAHAIPNGRSIMKCRSTRRVEGKTVSNIVWNYPHNTIPRHLRDIFITEYGIADLRGKTDSEIIRALLNICDSRFQQEILQTAKSVGKIEANYEIPKAYCQNLPDRLSRLVAEQTAMFPTFPFGTDLTAEEIKLGAALGKLRGLKKQKYSILKLLRLAYGKNERRKHALELKRMGLDKPKGIKESFYSRLVANAL